jgi:hypothetical protein
MLTRRSTGSIGATQLLKVMAGDKIHTKVDYYYSSSDATATNNGTTALSSIVSSIVNSLATSSAPTNLIHGGENVINSQLGGNSDLSSAVIAAANTNPNNPSQQAPKAYLCVLFLMNALSLTKTVMGAGETG